MKRHLSQFGRLVSLIVSLWTFLFMCKNRNVNFGPKNVQICHAMFVSRKTSGAGTSLMFVLWLPPGREYARHLKVNWSHKYAENHWRHQHFRSTAKCYLILHKSAQNGSGRPKGWIIRPLFNWDSPRLQGHPCRHNLKPHWKRRHHLLPFGIYRGSKNGGKCRIRRLCLRKV